MESSSDRVLGIVRESQKAAVKLAQVSGAKKRQGVLALAEAIESGLDAILEANTLDLELSREMAIAEPIAEWLKLTPERLESTVAILRQLAKSAAYTKGSIDATFQLEASQTYSQLIPLGTIALIYEAFPELAAIAAGMCLKTGNSLITRGCSVASNSNRTIHEILQTALDSTDLPPNIVQANRPRFGHFHPRFSYPRSLSQPRYSLTVVPATYSK